MSTASQRWELAKTASLIDRILLLDGLWAGELAAQIAESDRSTVIAIGKEIVGLVGELAGALGPVRRWAMEEPYELGEVVDRALRLADRAPGQSLASELRACSRIRALRPTPT
jgi:hypothetical protein